MKKIVKIYFVFVTVVSTPICRAEEMTEVEPKYVGCAQFYQDEDDAKSLFLSYLFGGHNEKNFPSEASPLLCAHVCLRNGFKYSAYDLDRDFYDNEGQFCWCDNKTPSEDQVSHKACSQQCGDGLPRCPPNFDEYSPVYKTVEKSTNPLILVIGGQRLKDPEIVAIEGVTETDGYDCTNIVEAPIDTKGTIALYLNEKPMICGGARWDDDYTQSCFVYDNVANAWDNGPTLYQRRMYAAVAKTNDGVYWVFGGKWGNYAEWLNDANDQFVKGPKMPIQTTINPCAATKSDGNIYFLGTDSANNPASKATNTQLYEFDLENEDFGEPKEMPERLFHMTCQNFDLSADGYGDLFVVIGGKNRKQEVSTNIYVYNSENDSWTTLVDAAPPGLLGSASVLVPKSDENSEDMMLTIGGKHSDSVYAFTITDLERVDGEVKFDVKYEESTKMSKPRIFPVALLSNVKNVCKEVENEN